LYFQFWYLVLVGKQKWNWVTWVSWVWLRFLFLVKLHTHMLKLSFVNDSWSFLCRSGVTTYSASNFKSPMLRLILCLQFWVVAYNLVVRWRWWMSSWRDNRLGQLVTHNVFIKVIIDSHWGSPKKLSHVEINKYCK